MPKWSPRGEVILGISAPGRSKTVLGSSWFGPFFVLRFGFAFLALLGASWGRLGSLWASFWTILGSLGLVLGRLGLSWARFWALRMAFWSPIALYAHQLINPSTRGSSVLCNLGRRTARCAIKSAATRRVGACPNSFRILVRILRTQKVQPGHAHSAGAPGPAPSHSSKSISALLVGQKNRSKNRSKF